MEYENINFPNLNELITPRLTKVCKFIGNLFKQVSHDVPDYQSNHFKGGAQVLDNHLYGESDGDFE